MLNFGFVENYQTGQMIIYPTAKINIGLYVNSKRDDGYHNISSFFLPISLSDIIEIIPDDNYKLGKDTLNTTGITIPSTKTDNLIIQACKELRQFDELPFFNIHLHKIIPIGAGLGGGSSDGAFVLKAANKFLNAPLPAHRIKDIALLLGSDCPFFLNPVGQIASSRGEILKEVAINLEDYWISIFNPGIHISTRKAYELVEIGNPEIPLEKALNQPVEQWRNTVFNVFEKPVFNLHPEIESLKNKLYEKGAVFASMSGSGSSVFGLFHKKPEWTGSLKKHHIWTENLIDAT